MYRAPPGTTRTDTPLPSSTLFRASGEVGVALALEVLLQVLQAAQLQRPRLDARHPGQCVGGDEPGDGGEPLDTIDDGPRTVARPVAVVELRRVERRNRDRKSTRLNSSH